MEISTAANTRPNRFQRYIRRVRKALMSRHSPVVLISESLTGAAAETWISLREASEGLPFGDKELIVLLEMRAARRLRAELRELDRE